MADRIGVIPALVVSSLLSFLPMVMYWKVLRRPTEITVPIGETVV
jgi:hypothetical protein